MKGVVFKELIGMVETVFGEETAEDIIAKSNLKSEGAYTSVGTYDHGEILELVTNLSQSTSTPANALVKAFGKHLAQVFKGNYEDFFKGQDTLSFLSSVDGIIHVEVKKLYPDAELPQFKYEQASENELIMNYSSSRPFADLAEGLIEGVIAIFGENIELKTESISDDPAKSRKFIIKKV